MISVCWTTVWAADRLELLRESAVPQLPGADDLLTGQGDHEIDLEAMKAGAADYLIKGQLSATPRTRHALRDRRQAR